MKYLDDVLPQQLRDRAFATGRPSSGTCRGSDLVIGAVLVAGTVAPKLVTRDMLHLMQPRSVVVDVAVDQGGCFETTHATTHQDPVYYEEGVLHYAVANMPGAYPRTSTLALTNVTLRYVLDLGQQGCGRGGQGGPLSSAGHQHLAREADVQGRGRIAGRALARYPGIGLILRRRSTIINTTVKTFAPTSCPPSPAADGGLSARCRPLSV